MTMPASEISINELMTSKQRLGKSNGRWGGGKSVSYYRRKAGKKPNDGKIVHHVKKGPKGGKGYGPKAKYRLVTPAQHNRLHPEKGGRH
jgi:hypothetical protein